MSKKIEVFMKNQRGSSEYNAIAEFYGDRIVVLKGSKINSKFASSKTFNLNALVKAKSEDKSLLSKNYLLLKDTEFNSASTAGQFVCGYSVSGLTLWKDKNTLRDILKGEK